MKTFKQQQLTLDRAIAKLVDLSISEGINADNESLYKHYSEMIEGLKDTKKIVELFEKDHNLPE
jgi:hypothetical protein